LRHTFATWSRAAGLSIFTHPRRMGTSVPVTDSTYGHLARDADGNDRGRRDGRPRAHARVRLGSDTLNDASYMILIDVLNAQ
jgi:hypothetical protein